jgi:serine/threonine protein kinase/WD40 repeat protein
MSSTELNLVNQLAEEFLDRLRRGEQPSIAEFASRYPEHANEIRELLSTLRVIEKAKPTSVKSSANYRSMELPIPSQLGDYRIIREVARGGMGIVYEAEQQALGRRVALKVLSAPAARKPQNLVRFSREARSAGRLHHTNIVPVHDIGCEQGIHFYTMQLIEGSGLDEVIAQLLRFREPGTTLDPECEGNGSADSRCSSFDRIVDNLLSKGFLEPTPVGSDCDRQLLVAPPESDSSQGTHSETKSMGSRRSGKSTPTFHRNVARIGLQVADALAYAHGHKLLHRDIKPSNILLDVHGNVWVTDFGLAKDEDLDLTATGDLVGTLRYMAPERFQGTADIRSDIFSLGLTLYELLTLSSCLPRSDRSIGLRLNAPRDLPAPRTVDHRIPPDLETIVLKAIEHDPRQRYATAESMANDLRLFLADRPILARPVTRLERTWMWVRRNRLLAGTTAAACVLLILSCLSWIATQITRTQRDNALRAETSALVHEHLARATYYCASGRPGSRFKALEEIEQAVKLGPVPDQRALLRDAAITALAMHDSRVQSIEHRAFQPKSENIEISAKDRYEVLAITSDYRRAAVKAPGQHSLVVIDLATQAVLTELPVSADSPEINFSRSGALLAIREADRTSLIVYQTETWKEVFSGASCHRFDVSRDDRWLAIATTGAAVKLADLRGVQPDRTLSVREKVSNIALSPDGSRLAITYRGAQTSPVTILDCDSGKAIQELDRDAFSALEWHPDGQRLAIATWQTVELWDVESDVLQWSSSDQHQTVGGFSISPDGQWLLAHYWDGKSRLWDLNARKESLRLDQSVNINWNPDSNLLGWRSVESAIEYVHFEQSPILKTLPTSQNMNELPFSGAFSRDGKWAIASTTYNNSTNYQYKLDIIDLQSQARVGRFEADLLRSFNLSEDGRLFSVVHGREWSRFPLQTSAAKEKVYGPPDSFSLPGDPIAGDISADGTKCAIIQSGRFMAFRVEDSASSNSKPMLETIVDLPNKHGHDLVRISPDGKWAATRFWHSPIVSVWDLAQSKLLGELTLGAQSIVMFTPDSTRLVTSRQDAYRFWELPELTNTFSLPRVDCALPDQIAFDEIGQQAVVSLRPDAIDVVDLRTGESRLHLHRPGLERNVWMAFHPRGAAILTGSHTAKQVALWDLHALYLELARLGLAVDEGPTETPTEPSGVERVSIVGLNVPIPDDFVGAMPEERARQALQLLEESHLAKPNMSTANDLAWALLMAPETLRNPPRALELAKLAIQQSQLVAPSAVRNTLAAAYYRNREFAKAIEALGDNLAVTNDTELPWDLYILSLSHAGLGDVQSADHYFQLGQRWNRRKSEDVQRLKANQLQELESLRAEAQAALDALHRESQVPAENDQ